MLRSTSFEPTDEDFARTIREIEASVQGYSTDPRDIATIPVNKTIDHTLLKQDATSDQIDQLCAEAKKYNFATVCVRPGFVSRCVQNLQGTDIGIASVIGFHEGTYSTEEKLLEVTESVSAGATELDVVINWPDLKAGRYSKISSELMEIQHMASESVLKLILETSQLDDHEIVAGTFLAFHSLFDYIKTSTGFNGHGATLPHVKLMAAVCAVLSNYGRTMKVKASGGIRSYETAVSFIEAGADRLGTSAGIAIAEHTTTSTRGTAY